MKTRRRQGGDILVAAMLTGLIKASLMTGLTTGAMAMVMTGPGPGPGPGLGAGEAVGAALTVENSPANSPTSGKPFNRIEDIQFGETDDAVRIAFVCTERCDIVPDGAGADVFGAYGLFDISLSDRSQHIRSIKITPAQSGSHMLLEPRSSLVLMSVEPCTIHGSASVCLDYKVNETGSASEGALALRDGGPTADIAAAEMVGKAASSPDAAKSRGDGESGGQTGHARHLEVGDALSRLDGQIADLQKQVDAELAGGQPPALREGAEILARSDSIPATDPDAAPILGTLRPTTLRTTNLRPASFPPATLLRPERLSPPIQTAPEPRALETSESASKSGANIDAASGDIGASTSSSLSISARAEEIVSAGFDFRGESENILGFTLGEERCRDARQRLQKDAWAIDAMVEGAFCKALSGQLDAADDDFSRLLDYAPRHMEALVGRGLVAAERGDINQARGFLSDSLASAPPWSAQRINEALSRL